MDSKNGKKGSRSKRIAVTGLSTVAVLAGLVGFLGFTRAGTAVILKAAAPLLTYENQTIKITGAGPLLTGNLDVERIEVGDAKGVFATVEGLSVDWSPLALLRMRFDASSIRAAKVNFERMPESPGSSSTSSSSSGLPVAINVNSVSLPQIALGASFSGKPERLSLDGSFSIDSDAAIASAAIQDLGNSAANATFSLNYNLAGETLALDLEASEPKGGLIAGLLGLPDKPALGFQVKGEGALADWKGTAAASVEGMPVARFETEVRKPTTGPIHVALNGGGALDAILPPSVEPLFKGRTNVDLALSLDPQGSISVEKGQIASEAVAIALSGTLSSAGANDFKASLRPVSDGAVFSLGSGENAVSMRLGNADVAVNGSANNAAFTINAALERLNLSLGTLDNITLSAQATGFDIADRSGDVAVSLGLGGSALKDAALQRLVQTPVKIEAPIKVTADDVAGDFTLQSGALSGTGSFSYALASSDIASTFKLFAAPSALPEPLSGRLDKAIALSGKLAVSGNNIEVSGLDISSQLLTASGSASLQGDRLAADISGSLPDLSKLQAEAEGKGTFTLAANGTLAAPEGKVTLSVPEAVLSGKKLEAFDFEAAGKLADGGLAGNVRATGSIGGQPIEASAVMKQLGSGTDIPDIKVVAGSNTITGAIQLDSSFQPSGRLAFDLSDLSLIGSMSGQPLSGALKGALAIEPAGDQLTAKLSLIGGKVTYDTVNVAGVNVDLAYEDAALSGNVKASEIASGGQAFKNAALSFSGDAGKTDFDLTGNYDGGPVAVRGAVATGEVTTVHLDEVSATVRKIALKLASPTDISIANGTASFRDLTIAVGTGRVSVSGSAGQKLDLQAKIENLPAQLANNFSTGLGAEGAISGTVKVSGKATNPVAEFSLSWPSATLAATRSAGAPALDVKANGRFSDNTLNVDASAAGGGLSVKGGGKLTLAQPGTISMRFSGSAPLSLAQAMVAPQGIGLSGTANLDVSVDGNLSAPKIGGKAVLASAGVVLARQNLNLTDITGTVTLGGDQATITGLQGKFSGGGSFSASGTLGIASGSGFPADLSVKVVDARYTDGSLVQAELGGDITVKGPLAGGAVIGGQVAVRRAAITVPEKIPASLAAIKLQHKNAPKDVLAQAAELRGDEGGHSQSSSPLLLSLEVVARNQIFVRGRGMDAELGGSVKISGSTASPIVSGGFEMIRGRLSILGKRLDFSSGKIGFGGGLVPDLNLEATTSSSSLGITVTVSGPANDPEFTFSSSPARPQDEVLAQLVFGRSASSLSPLQIAQLADAVLQLSGGQSTSVFTKLRKGVGIDDLDVTTDSNGNAQVTAGKYLNDKTYLELQQGSTAGSGKAIINLDAGKGIKLRGEADSSGAGAAGIFFEKEY